ncbi:MAG: thioredoxin [Porphyromonadaceae bacterium]|nr:thioredoxin [Porphyromonadaceae bacterium]
MRKITILFVAILTLTAMSCNNTSKSENKEAKVESSEVSELQKNNEATDSLKVVNEPIHLTTAEFKKIVMNYEDNPSKWVYLGDKPAIVDFWATWCPPCKVIAPILDDLAKEYAGQIYIYKVDVDKEPQLARAFGIQSIPTLFFVPMTGDPTAEVGAISKDTFKDKIDNFMLAKK